MQLSSALDINPLPTHEITSAEGQDIAISKAMELLSPLQKAFVQHYVDRIYWMDLKEDADDECITSASFPAWPGRVFISDKALVHIPPNLIFEEPTAHALAENIYHEAIHQHVNERVLSGEIMADEFDSQTSPKIEIAWRRDHVARNQFWELDRAYHAACVYSGLLPLRERFVLEGESDFQSALIDGRNALKYLLDHLEEFKKFFKPMGLETLLRLRTEAYV